LSVENLEECQHILTVSKEAGKNICTLTSMTNRKFARFEHMLPIPAFLWKQKPANYDLEQFL